MRCSKCSRRLALYVGGDLSAREAAKVEEHLSVCEACRAELAGLKSSLVGLSAAECTDGMLLDDDPSYWLEVESKLRGRLLEMEHLSARTRWWVGVPRILAQAAVVLVVAGLVVWFTQLTPRTADVPKTDSARIERRRPPVVAIIVRSRSPYQQVEAFAPPEPDNEAVYSDTQRIVRPAEIRRFQNQVLPVVAEEHPGRF